MSLELYFLRSSEQKIVTDMLYYSQQLNETNNTLEKFKELKIYSDFYGLTPKDLGLYALKENVIAGAVWSRRLSDYHNSNAFVLNDTPILNIAVKPEFRNQGIATALITQFLQEASTLYELISISAIKQNISFMEKFGFEVVKNSEHKSYVTQEDSLIMTKKLQKIEKQERYDDYSNCKWLD
ncbi:GNAT family N-acetyltransferase [Sulfurimonas sp.]